MRLAVILALILTALIAAIIGKGTLSPPGNGAPLPLTDKQLHAIAFALLVLPLGWVRPRWALALAIMAFGFGSLIELLQPRIGRSGEWADLWADTFGIALGLLPGQLRRSARIPDKPT